MSIGSNDEEGRRKEQGEVNMRDRRRGAEEQRANGYKMYNLSRGAPTTTTEWRSDYQDVQYSPILTWVVVKVSVKWGVLLGPQSRLNTCPI